MTAKARPPDLPRYLSAAELQEWLGIKRTKLYDLVEQGLPYRALSSGGRTKVFVPEEVQAWLDARKRAKVPTATPAEAGAEAPRRGRPPKAKGSNPDGPWKWVKDFE